MIPTLLIDEWTPGANIQRTMNLLASGSHVKILFYGQSITRQDWWKAVVENLKRRFPKAEIEAENRAIGGFAANLLKRVVQHDVRAAYPDLIVLQDYGGEPDYEELIANIRRDVSSEILLQSDHLNWTGKPGEAPPRAQVWHDQHARWLQAFATKNRLGFVDVREQWRRYLTDHRLEAPALLSDGIHLNAAGCELMAKIIDGAFVVNPAAPHAPDPTYDVEVRWKGRSSAVTIDGSRLDLISSEPLPADVRVSIDGGPPTAIKETWLVSRPSDAFHCDVPGIFRVESRAPIVVEKWTLTLKDVQPSAKSFRFSVNGSVTGDDGEGESGRDFVSKSGRVAIPKDAWYVHEAASIVKQTPPDGFQFQWEVTPLALDIVKAGSRHATIAIGLKPGPHVVRLYSTIEPKRLTLRAWRPNP